MIRARNRTRPGAMKRRAVPADRARRGGFRLARSVWCPAAPATGAAVWSTDVIEKPSSLLGGRQERVDLAGCLGERFLHGLLALERKGQFVLQHRVDLWCLRDRRPRLCRGELGDEGRE